MQRSAAPPSITGPLVGGTVGSILFVGTGGIFQQDNANLFWDDANNRLGIGTTTPNHAVHINSALSAPLMVQGSTASTGIRMQNSNNANLFIDYTTTTLSFLVNSAATATINLIGGAPGTLQFLKDSTGAGTALLSTNCPAVTVSAPFTWWNVTTSDGSAGFIPVWK